MNKDIIKDCMAFFEERGIGCRNIIDDVVEIVVRTSVGGKSDCWVQISEEEVYHRANEYQEEE